jgi:hypothetical protein
MFFVAYFLSAASVIAASGGLVGKTAYAMGLSGCNYEKGPPKRAFEVTKVSKA